MRVLTLAIFHEPSRWTLPESVLASVRDGVGADVEVRLVGSREQLAGAIEDTDYLAGMPLTESQLRVLPRERLRWVQLTSRVNETPAAVRWMTGMGLRVTTCERARARQCAEHAIMLTLSLLRGLPECVRAQDGHLWAGDDLGPNACTLGDLHVAVIGAGPVAHALAPILGAFGCQTVFVGDFGASDAPNGASTLPAERIDEAMSLADVVIVASPMPERATPIIRRAELQTLKPTGVVVDVSRSGLVSEADLARSLQREEIAGAGVDVFEHAPPPPESPLWTMPNLILTPSISAVSADYWRRVGELIVENTKRIESDQPLLDEVRLRQATVRG